MRTYGRVVLGARCCCLNRSECGCGPRLMRGKMWCQCVGARIPIDRAEFKKVGVGLQAVFSVRLAYVLLLV